WRNTRMEKFERVVDEPVPEPVSQSEPVSREDEIRPREGTSTPADNFDAEHRQTFGHLGIYTVDTLEQFVRRDARKPFIIDGIIRPHHIHLLVGDSGLGKTPLAIQLGICVASGT